MIMKKNKFILENVLSTDFLVMGINASTEMYKLAYLINKALHIQLSRTAKDIDFYYDGGVALFPLYEYDSAELQSKVYFIANKSYCEENHLNPSGTLFSAQETHTNYRLRYLVPELKKVDYIIKIEDATLDQINYKKMLFQLNSIKQIATAYQIDNQQIKKPENLIFH